MEPNELRQRSERLLEDIKSAIESPDLNLSDKAIGLLEKLMNAVPYLERLRQPELKLCLGEIARAALFIQNGNGQHLKIAQKILKEIERRRKIYDNIILSIYYSRSPFGYVLTGLSSILILLIGIFVIGFYGLKTQLNEMTILGVIGAGALGGIVSILTRIRKFAVVNHWGDSESSPAVLFFTGFFKPLLGMAFAVFIYAVLNTGIIQINTSIIGEDNRFWFYFALAFLSGFSERFAPDVAEKIENAVTTGDHNNDKKGDENPENNPVG